MSNTRFPRALRFLRENPRADFRDELAFHVEQRVAELVAMGMSSDAARAEALRRIGDVNALADVCVPIGAATARRRRRIEWLHTVRDDLRIALRQFTRTPAVSLVCVITLALGIGANTAVFSIAHSVLLNRLPYRDADRLVRIAETLQEGTTGVGPGQFTEWTRRARAFEVMSAMTYGAFSLDEGTAGGSQRVSASYVTPSYFRTLYMPPVAGRYLADDEAVAGKDNVVVIGEGVWVQRFGGDTSVVGRTIRLDGRPYTVVGIAPREYALRRGDPELWVPLSLTTAMRARFGEHWLTVFAKRKAAVGADAAQRDMERVTREIAILAPDEMVNRSVRVTDARADLVADYRLQILVLFGAVAAVLLLACCNVAALLVARLSARRREIAIRRALGAGRMRLMRQLVTESALLAAVSGACSTFVTMATLRGIASVAPADVPRLTDAAGGPTVVGFAVALTIIAGLALGLLPALRITRGALTPSLRASARAESAEPRDRVRDWLVMGEVSLATVLLVGALLFVRSAHSLNRIEAGFDERHLVTAHLALTTPAYDSAAALERTLELVNARLARVPHVQAVTATSSLPLLDGGPDVELNVQGRTYAPGQAPSSFVHLVSSNYFGTMRIPIVNGRAFSKSDGASSPRVAIVSDAVAKSVWPNGDAIGARVSCCGDQERRMWREVVGVAAPVHHWLDRDPLPVLYVPADQAPATSWTWFGRTVTVAMRTDGQRVGERDVRRAVADVDPLIAVSDVRAMTELRRASTSSTRFALTLFSVFALLAVSLTAIGVYGVVAYLVAQRAPEIAVRFALGASRLHVFALVLKYGAALVAAGVIAGVLAATMASRPLEYLLYGVKPTDPITYVAVVIGLTIVAFVACYVPARRAALVDPAAVLRS